MAAPLTDPNSDAANSDIGAFRDDHWFVAGAQKIGKRRHRQERNKKKGQHSILHGILPQVGTLLSPMFGRMRALYSYSLYRIDQWCSRERLERT